MIVLKGKANNWPDNRHFQTIRQRRPSNSDPESSKLDDQRARSVDFDKTLSANSSRFGKFSNDLLNLLD